MKKSVVFFGHHKCGSRFFRHSIMRPLAQANGRNVYGYKIDKPLYHFSTLHDLDLDNIDFSVLASDQGCVLNLSNAGAPVVEAVMAYKEHFVGIHAVRDPRQLLVSNYFYHKEKHEVTAPNQWHWCKLAVDKPILQRLSQEDGLRYEFDNITKDILENQFAPWTANDNILEYKLEEFTSTAENGGENLKQLMKFCGFEKEADINLAQTWSYDAGQHSWQSLFSKELKSLFKDRYGSLLIRLGYEENYDW